LIGRKKRRRIGSNIGEAAPSLTKYNAGMRALILIHRYLGIVIGLVMAMWCASGFVMMYVGFPGLDSELRLRTLQPITWQGCCAYEKIGAALGVDVVDDFNVEMAAGRPLLRVFMSQGWRQSFDLISGERVASITDKAALTIARRHASSISSTQEPQYQALLERDQWTVQGQLNRDRPLHHIALGDEYGTELYVSSTSGQVVQHTTAKQRFWNWLGAVPHWLYPTVLRQHAAVWAQAVIWLSLAGVFLTVIGLYIGIAHWRAMKGARWSPYRGVGLWHHLSGLLFGVLTLTWVGSGLVSMSPWGLFESAGFNKERDRVRDVWIDGTQIAATLRGLAAAPQSVTRIESAPLAGNLYLLAYHGLQVKRLNAKTLAAAPLALADVQRIAGVLARGQTAKVELLVAGDAYYYAGHEARELPVYRVALNDAEQTRYYLNPTTGDVVDKIDPNRRAYRWLFEGLHRLDFTAFLRQRPWWDLIVLPLLLGVSVLCFTGVYMGYKRITPRRNGG